jgi:hypothetical protein
MKVNALTISLTLLVSGLAHAQGALDRITGTSGERVSVSSRWSENVSPAERAYGTLFAENLRIQRQLTVRRIDLSYTLGEEVGIARGVAFQFGPDDTLRRLRFPTREAAQDFALQAVHANRPVGIQVIENQVVVIAGPSVSDPARAWPLFEAAWRGLPVQGKPVQRSAELSLVFTGPETFLASSFLQERPELDEALRRRGEELDREGLATWSSLGFLAATDAPDQAARQLYMEQAMAYSGRRAPATKQTKPKATKPKATKPKATKPKATKPRKKRKGLLERLKELSKIRIGGH